MKKVYIIIVILFISSFVNVLFAQARIEYKQGTNKTYRFEYTDEGSVIVSDASYPYNNFPHSSWEGRVKITDVIGDLNKMVYDHIGPCTRALKINQVDSNMNTFFMSIAFGLDGEVKEVVFGYSEKIQTISLNALEALETEIKQNHKLVLEYDPNEVRDVWYVNIIQTFSIKYIREKEFEKDLFIPTPPLVTD